MAYEISVSKGYDGKKAETLIPLPGIKACGESGGEAKLSITTYKSMGTLTTFGKVAEYCPDGKITMVLFADYGKRLMQTPGVKATEKAIIAQHTAVLEQLPAVLADITEFYAAKAAKVAA